jgi:hypothetical protein
MGQLDELPNEHKVEVVPNELSKYASRCFRIYNTANPMNNKQKSDVNKEFSGI